MDGEVLRHFGGSQDRVASKRVVLADVAWIPKNRNETGTRVQKTERGHIRQNHPFAKPLFCFLGGSFRVCPAGFVFKLNLGIFRSAEEAPLPLPSH